MTKKIFITGGNGFIGCNLIEQLDLLGYEVISYDINNEGGNKNNIQGDILDYDKLVSAMEGADIVCHLAAKVGVVECIMENSMLYDVNYYGVINVINACKINNIKNIVFASSSEVYGEGEGIKLTEDRNLKPKSPYGILKMEAENLFKSLSIESDIKITVLRYCNIYGEKQRKVFVVPRFINQVLNKENITVCGKGAQTRTFTYIDDAIEGTIKAIERTKGEKYEVINICSNEGSSILNLANNILKLNDSEGNIEFLEVEEINRRKDFEIISRNPCGKKAECILNFKARIHLQGGLRKTYKYYKKLKDDFK
ncbi:MAG: NAD-dependent epimerase/dehydratase family protein [Sarcina sp.]